MPIRDSHMPSVIPAHAGNQLQLCHSRACRNPILLISMGFSLRGKAPLAWDQSARGDDVQTR